MAELLLSTSIKFMPWEAQSLAVARPIPDAVAPLRNTDDADDGIVFSMVVIGAMKC